MLVVLSNMILCSFFLLYIQLSPNRQRIDRIIFRAYLFYLIYHGLHLFSDLHAPSYQIMLSGPIIILQLITLFLCSIVSDSKQKLAVVFVLVSPVIIYFLILLPQPAVASMILSAIGMATSLYALRILSTSISLNVARRPTTAGTRIKWLINANYVLFFVWVLCLFFDMAVYFFDYQFPPQSVIYLSAIATYIIILSYFLQIRPGVREAQGDTPETMVQPTAVRQLEHFFPINKAQKYLRSSLSDDEIQHIAESISYWIDREKLFLHPNLNLDLLAAKTQTSRHKLSQYFSKVLKQSFSHFINSRRVREFKQRVAEDNEERFTLLAHAFESGFRSKSSFNLVFKDLSGETPKQFSKRIRHKASPK